MKKLIILVTCTLLTLPTFAQIKVAAAANLQQVINVLQQDFKQKTGIVIEPIIGSSGNLTTQIRNGAPFDVFLSADMSFPDALYKAGFTVAKPEVYALGSLIVCSAQHINLKHWETLVRTDSVQKIAIANPAIAPYGKAAMEALHKYNIADKIKSKIVYGENIAQVNNYITAGVVTLGFTSQSFIMDAVQKDPFYWSIIDPKLYSPIQQGMVILKHSRGNNLKQAKKFYKYLLSSSAKAIFKKYGYRAD